MVGRDPILVCEVEVWKYVFHRIGPEFWPECVGETMKVLTYA